MAIATRVIPVQTRVYQLKHMVDRADPKRATRPEPGYRFSNGRQFKTPRDPYISAK